MNLFVKVTRAADLPDWMVIEVVNGRVHVSDSETIFLTLSIGQVETFVAELLAARNKLDNSESERIKAKTRELLRN